MPNKYKHIKLPTKLISAPTSRLLTTNPNPQKLLPITPDEEAVRRTKISNGLKRVEEYEKSIENSAQISQDGYYELKIDLRRGGKELLKRLNIEPYRRKATAHSIIEDGEVHHYTEETVIGKVSTVKLDGERYSNFEKLKNELADYIENNNLPSYYDAISNIQPLTLEEVAEEELAKEIESVDQNTRIMVDIVFADKKDASELKMSSLEKAYNDYFILKVNSELSHYCRLSLNKSEIETVLGQYKGIVELTHAPTFIASEGQTVASDGITPIDKTSDAVHPIIVADRVISTSHPLLNTNDILVDQVGDTSRVGNHGTQVASLVVYGRRLPLNGEAVQRNKVIGLNVFLYDPVTQKTTFNESLVKDTVEAHQSSSKALIINMSANDSYSFYDRKNIHHITLFLDELAHANNCTFTISAGNMNEINDFYAAGDTYPSYFDRKFTTILAPADSINNITVGAITYQESADSIAPREHPSPITRRGFEEKKFGFIKPDLVQYDSNCILESNEVKAEHNGPNLATGDTGTTKNIGTSFAAPLAAHDLGLLAAQYPSYKAQTLKALAIHFSHLPSNLPTTMTPERVNSLMGHGITNIDEALNSLNTASTIVIEDSIPIKTSRSIPIPIPEAIKGSQRKRLRIRITLGYAVKPNNVDMNNYSPINLSAHLERDDNYAVSKSTTQSYLNGAHKRSNLKKYPPIEKQTVDHMGKFWNIILTADPLGDFLPDSHTQPYSMIVTIEDIEKDDSLDIHQEISQMIEVRSQAIIEVTT